jgi:transcriptional regulator with XRE-family HTH domain
MSQKHRTHREIRQEFTPERQQEISDSAAKIDTKLTILSTVRQAAGITQEELADLLNIRQSHISQMESRDDITLGNLVGAITAMGGSINLTVEFPGKPSVQFSQIETLFPEKSVVDGEIPAIRDRNTQIEPFMQRRREILAKSTLTKKDKKELQELELKIGNLPMAESAADIQAMDIIRKAAKLLEKQQSS